MGIGKRIKSLRISKGISQTGLADIVGISKQTLYKYENDVITNIPSDKIEAIAKALNTTPAHLMGWDTAEYTVPEDREIVGWALKNCPLPLDLPDEVQALNSRLDQFRYAIRGLSEKGEYILYHNNDQFDKTPVKINDNDIKTMLASMPEQLKATADNLICEKLTEINGNGIYIGYQKPKVTPEKDFNKIFSDNLNFYLSLNGTSQLDLAKYLGVSATSVTNWCRGLKMPRMDKVDKMCKYFNINRSDLMSPKSSEWQNRPAQTIRIKVYGSVPAGIPIEAIKDVVGWEDIPAEWARGGHEYIGLKVKGDSMQPKYLDEDTVIIKLQPDCESGQDAVVYVNGYDATLKKVIKKADCLILQPLNPSYEPKVYSYEDEFNPVIILGIVVEIRRRV